MRFFFLSLLYIRKVVDMLFKSRCFLFSFFKFLICLNVCFSLQHIQCGGGENSNFVPPWQRGKKAAAVFRATVIPDAMISQHFGISGMVNLTCRWKSPVSIAYGLGPVCRVSLFKIHFLVGCEHFLPRDKDNRYATIFISGKIQFAIMSMISIMGGFRYNFGKVFYSKHIHRVDSELIWFIGIGGSIGTRRVSLAGYLGGGGIIRFS